MALTIFFWNARSLPRKAAELQSHLRDTLPSVVGLCETWMPPHLSLNLLGYTILRKDCPQGHGGGVLLALCDELHFPFSLPPWPAGRLEVVASRVRLQRNWLTVAVIYNPGGATHQEFDHFIASLPLLSFSWATLMPITSAGNRPCLYTTGMHQVPPYSRS